jgi:hypothetical protein
MKNLIRLLAFIIIVLSTCPAHATVVSLNVVGYYNYVFGAGNTLFASQLDDSPNDLATLFLSSTPANGTTISLWDPTTETFNTASTYSSGAWSVDLTLQAGIGYRLNTAATFTNTFIGTVLNHDGSLYTGTLTPPPVYAGPGGIYLVGDKSPYVDTGTDIFLNILGRLPNIGEQVITLASTSTYLGGGSWSGGVPTLNVGDAALLNIGPVPEPSTVSLGLIGMTLVHVFRRRRL